MHPHGPLALAGGFCEKESCLRIPSHSVWHRPGASHKEKSFTSGFLMNQFSPNRPGLGREGGKVSS